MEKREKRKRRKRRSKNIYIYLVFAAMICIIVSSAIYQTFFLPEIEKLPAEDYFEIRDALVIDADWAKSTDDVLFITQIRFNLTAVGGDAHSVLIQLPGMSQAEDWPFFSEMKQNVTIDVRLPLGLPLGNPVRSVLNSEGYFPFRIKMDCREASGFVVILL